MLAKNIPLLLGRGEREKEAAAFVFDHPDDTTNNLIKLGKVCRVKVTYKLPTTKVLKGKYRSKESNVHVYGGFFMSGDQLCYQGRASGRIGYMMPSIDLIESYEPVLSSSDKFDSLDEFCKKFDKRFITEAFIKRLWNETSSQTGNQYTKKDFHKIGPVGKQVLNRFCRSFIDVSTETPHHRLSSSGEHKSLSEYHRSYHRLGRDISITHTMGFERVHYSSEYSGCGNGRYGLVANMHEFLHLEDD